MKRNNALKVVLATIVILAILTWIFPVAYFQESYVEQARAQVGLFDLFNYPITALSYFGFVGIFVLVIGGFYAILNKTGAYRVLLDKIVSKSKGKEKIILSVIMVLLAVATSVCGLQLPLLALFPFIISLVLLMGYDKKTAATVTVGSVVVGLAGTTFAYSVSSILMQVFSLKVIPDKITAEFIAQFIILVAGLALLIFETIRHIGKMDKEKPKNHEKLLEDYAPAEVKGSAKKQKVWPLVVILDLIFLIMILSFISWSGAFNLDIFEKATTAVTEFKIAKFPIFGKILGTVNPFGAWTLTELSLVLVIASIVIALIYKVKFNDYIQTMLTGARRALRPALVIVLIYTCLVLTTYHPFQLFIYNWLLKLTKGFNVATTTIVAGLASLLNVEPSYAFQSATPYIQSLVSDKSTYPLIALIFQSMYGLVMLVAPTSVVLMTTLSYLNISYKDWLKHIWRFALELLVGLVILFTVLVLI